MDDIPVVLVSGATGYIGGRLVSRLLAAGHRVRVLVRDPGRLQGRAWRTQVGIAQGDVLDPTTLPGALTGVHTAYYLIHSMLGGDDFHARDLAAARNFGRAARAAGVQHIIYLGGLGDPDADLSVHLRSRQQVGDALRESGVPVTEFRAAVIVGSESVSFRMISALTDRLPIMICPRWVFSRVQPIAIDNVLSYLIAALDTPESVGRVVEIGGTDVLTYGEMMLAYARVCGLRRVLIAVPFLTPRLSSYWVHWVTPIPAAIARPLIEGLRNEVVVRDDSARALFPHIQPMGYRAAVKLACAQTEADDSGDNLERCAGLQPARRISRRTPHGHRTAHRPANAGCAGTSRPGVPGVHAARWCTWLALRQPTVAIAWHAGPQPWAAWACAEVAAIRTTSTWAMPSISGAWRQWNPTRCSSCGRR